MKRRTMLRVAVGGALGIAGVAVDKHNAQAFDMDTLFLADYEDGSENSGNSLIGHNAFMFYSVDNVSAGRFSTRGIRHELRQGDEMESGGMRAESHSIYVPETRFGVGMVRYYGFSIYIPSTWEYDSIAEDIVFQWHNSPSPTEPCEPTKVPSAFLNVHPANGGEWRLRVNADANACSTTETRTKTHLGLGALTPGRWYDFAFRMYWHYDSTGRIDAWTRNSTATAWVHRSKLGGNTFNDDHNGGYLKWGIYKPSWNYGATTDVDKRAVFHDNIAVGTSLASVTTGSDVPSEENY